MRVPAGMIAAFMIMMTLAVARAEISVEYVDLEKRPTLANELKIQTAGTVVIDYEGRTERVTSDGEQELTNGLIKVVTGQERKARA